MRQIISAKFSDPYNKSVEALTVEDGLVILSIGDTPDEFQALLESEIVIEKFEAAQNEGV